MRIVAVDDDMSALDTLMHNFLDFEELDYKFFRTNPLAAVDYIASNVVDAAFLDINMPKIDGIELAKKIVKVSPQIKIVFITGYENDRAAIVGTFRANFAGFFYKPYDEEEMRLLLLNLFSSGERKIQAVTFGEFNLFINEESVEFSSAKSKELLAFLIDSDGGYVSMEKVVCELWQDKPTEFAKRLYRDAVWRLRRTLSKYGIENIVTFRRAKLAVNPETFSCDMWSYKLSNTGL